MKFWEGYLRAHQWRKDESVNGFSEIERVISYFVLLSKKKIIVQVTCSSRSVSGGVCFVKIRWIVRIIKK